jgi:hypothetical protein
MLNAIGLNVDMPSVVMMSDFMLNVVASLKMPETIVKHYLVTLAPWEMFQWIGSVQRILGKN